MELLIIFAIVFYAFIGVAPEELVKACLAMVWLLMILITVGTMLFSAVKALL